MAVQVRGCCNVKYPGGPLKFLFLTVQNDDFLPITEGVFQFSSCQNLQCTVVDILDDCVLEETEEFYLHLHELADQNTTVRIGAGDTKIEITDTDGISHTARLSMVLTWCILQWSL